jgi:hypothetical protein
MSEITFYQIQLFKKREIEIFQYTFYHEIKVKNGETLEIEIRHGQDGPGNCTVSTRPMEGVYEVRKIEEPIYQFKNVPEDSKVTIDGKHVFTPKKNLAGYPI